MIAAAMGFAVRASFLAGLLFAVGLSAYILASYARRAMRGNGESRWLGRHITAIAVAHLGALAWITGRFVAFGHQWELPWVIALGAILALSDYAIWQMYRYRRWRERRALGET